MMNVEQEMNIYHLLTQVILQGISGGVVELGCYKGATAAIMQKTIDSCNSKKVVHLYDSFKGLPPKCGKDGMTQFGEGWCATNEEGVYALFKTFSLRKPRVFKGWFSDTLQRYLPTKICFAHIDGDFYSSIKESLESVYPRLSKGAVVVIDDYYEKDIHRKIERLLNSNKYSKKSHRKIKIHDILPGVKKACDDFFKDKKESLIVLVAGEERHVYFRKV